jgi:DNA repair protein RecO (recombination protein O)
MSTLVTTDGIVLRHIRHGESSLILTVFSRDFGKIGLMAKGVRGPKKMGMASALELMSESQFVYYRKQGRDLQMLKEGASLTPHFGLRNDLDLMSIGSAVIELLARCLREEDPHQDLYDNARATLAALDAKPMSPIPVLWQFELDLFRTLGFGLQLHSCAETGLSLTPPFRGDVRYRLSEGSFLHPDASPGAPRDGDLTPEAFSVLVSITKSSRDVAGRIAVSARASLELTSFMARYLETHLPVRGQLRSLEALRWTHPSH